MTGTRATLVCLTLIVFGAVSQAAFMDGSCETCDNMLDWCDTACVSGVTKGSGPYQRNCFKTCAKRYVTCYVVEC